MKNNRRKIAIDIDEVLSQSAPKIVEYSNNRWGTSLSVDEYIDHWAQMWGVDLDETKRRADEIYRSDIFLSCIPTPFSTDAVRRLAENHDLIVVTARTKLSINDTYVWLNRYFPGIFPEENVHFAGIWDEVDDNSINLTKGELVKRLEVDYIIDDQVRHCLGAARQGVEALLFGDYSWNQLDPLPNNICRVNDWNGVLRFFDEVN